MKPDASEWTLITVTYNNAQELREWWYGNDLMGARWIVVDNNSVDETVQLAEGLGADVIALSENVGFSRANNVGLKRVASQFVAFVNPDVRVDASTLSLLGQVAVAHDAIVCPQLCNPDGSTQPNGRGLPYLVDKFAHRGLPLPSSSSGDYLPDTSQDMTYVAWAMGAAIGGLTARIKSSGGWDERFFLYYEDHAFGLDAWARGQEVILVPSARWIHAWKRETKGIKLRPWLREIASACRFYCIHPELLLPRRRRFRNRWKGQEHKFGQLVLSPPNDD